MAYVITENCVKCKYTDCVEVCPVDCFYEGENVLVINPDECIDCGVCEAECPAEAIFPDSTEQGSAWAQFNRDHSTAGQWPNLTRRKDPLPDAEAWNGKPNKADLVSVEPGSGD